MYYWPSFTERWMRTHVAPGIQVLANTDPREPGWVSFLTQGHWFRRQYLWGLVLESLIQEEMVIKRSAFGVHVALIF